MVVDSYVGDIRRLSILDIRRNHGLYEARHGLGLEDSLQMLQQELLADPEAGDVEPGTGGLRKIRMRDPGRGKVVYGKHESAKLTADQKRQLREIATQIREQA